MPSLSGSAVPEGFHKSSGCRVPTVTDFIMPCWKKSLSALVVAFCTWLLCIGVVQAADISLRNPQLELTDDSLCFVG